jgi:hypothetical protein
MEVEPVKLTLTREPMPAASVRLPRPGIHVSSTATVWTGKAMPSSVGRAALLADANGYGEGTRVRGVTGNDKFMTVRKQQQRDGIVPGIPPRGDTA